MSVTGSQNKVLRDGEGTLPSAGDQSTEQKKRTDATAKKSRRGVLAALAGAAFVKTAPRSRAALANQNRVYHLLNRISHGYTLADVDEFNHGRLVR